MRHSIVINRLPHAYEVAKEMNLGTDQRGSEYRSAGRRSLEKILEERMKNRISWYPDEMARAPTHDVVVEDLS